MLMPQIHAIIFVKIRAFVAKKFLHSWQVIIGYDDLVRSKTFTNRLKDQADNEELAKRKKGALSDTAQYPKKAPLRNGACSSIYP